MFYILENMNVENIVIGVQAEEYQNCKEFMQLVKQKNVRIRVLQKDNILKIDKETYLEVLFPDINNTILENKINNNSLVFKLIYNEFSMLFTGDIEEEAEQYLVNKYKSKLQSTILKVAHHGSKTSSMQEFINCIKPKIALIGVGKDNNFGHPNNEVLNRLIDSGCKIYRTDVNGEIEIFIAKKLKIKTKF